MTTPPTPVPGTDDRGIEYILPLRWQSDEGLTELTSYLAELRRWADVTVVDGSEPALFAAHAAAWQGLVRHLPVSGPEMRNGKVRGVLTGVAESRHERIVIADDDVRFDRDSLAAVTDDLATASLVRPQNHFVPRPWHARWDTGRTLVNRALGSDYPASSALWAPLWVAERAVTSWLALGSRLRGGVHYGGRRMSIAAHSERVIRERLAATGREGTP